MEDWLEEERGSLSRCQETPKRSVLMVVVVEGPERSVRSSRLLSAVLSVASVSARLPYIENSDVGMPTRACAPRRPSLQSFSVVRLF